MNLANKITLTRLALTVVCFFLLLQVTQDPKSLYLYPHSSLLLITILIYAFTFITDFLDGYVARRLGTITHFGRICDPLVDKILVVGSYIILITRREVWPILPVWMVVAIVAREFLVQGIRGFIESQGVEFGSNLFGKQKMVLQSLSILFILFYFGFMDHHVLALAALQAWVWVMFISTLLSGILYIAKSRKHLLQEITKIKEDRPVHEWVESR